MSQMLFRAFKPTFLGFDRVFDELERLNAAEWKTVNSFPPFNLYKEENGYSIQLAVAGFKKDDISVEHDRKRGVLTISGKCDSLEEDGREVISHGIAARSFLKQFSVADSLEVSDAVMKDGLLTVKLKQVQREEDKPLLIAVK